jgi:ABC-type iron transport system FetAB ATPase subunit
MLVVDTLTRPGLAPASLEVAAGECVILTGPSGSGKTLLLRAIADLDPADGSVRLDGRERAAMSGPAWRQRVRYVATEAGWWADGVGAHFPDAAAARPLLADLGLPDALAWPVSRLSTGERQRLALARALADAPMVLLLDEPTSGLDPAATDRVEGILRGRLADGVAILMISHDPEQARRLGHRRLTMADGRLAAAVAVAAAATP